MDNDEELRPTASPKGAPVVSRSTQVLPARQIQHIWFELTRARPWRSVAVLPVDDSAATFALAQELAQMASLDPRNKVLVVNVASMLEEEMAPGPGGGAFKPVTHGKYFVLDCAKQGLDEAQVGMVEVPRVVEDIRAGRGPYNMLIVAAHSALVSPTAVSAARAVDAVVICPTLTVSTLKDARRMLELVGAEQVVGSVSIRPRA